MSLPELVLYWPFILALAVTGAVSGVAAGLLGIGGGAIIVPALGLVLEALGYEAAIVQHVAVGTSLAIIIPTGLASASAHHRRGAVDGRALRLWVPFIVAGTLLGGLMARFYSGATLRIVFGVLAIFIAANILLPFQKRLMARFAGGTMAHRLSAFAVGYISALMGVGGGSFSVPTLVAFGQTMHRAVGTAAAIGVAIALSGTLGFIVSGWGVPDLPPLSLGFISLPALLLVGMMAAVTAPLGARLAHSLPQQTLKSVFAAFLVTVGLGMIWKALAA